jgi:hypothetical protein
MKQYLKNHSKGLKYLSFLLILVLPFFLYLAAENQITWAMYFLIILMGIGMFITLIIG